MKNIYLYLLVFSFAVVVAACKKDNDTGGDPLSQLPAATQIGANTFGCLVNGQVFLPDESNIGSSAYQCNYIYTNSGYSFNVGVSNDSDHNNFYSVDISTDSLAIVEGQTYQLKTFGIPKNAAGEYFHIYGLSSVDLYQTNAIITGQLYISHFDQTNQIVSGTFYFNAIRAIGDTVHVTDGRFDMHYTR